MKIFAQIQFVVDAVREVQLVVREREREKEKVLSAGGMRGGC